ncbi:MAG: PH domain-containing protein [Treponema sp.]|nr:PH domain-containing protein [Treponema sp.]
MKFIKKKNMLESEELLYTPQLHWIYAVRYVVRVLPFFIILPLLWMIINPLRFIGGSVNILYFTEIAVKYLFPAVIAVILLLLIWSIFQYICTEYGVTNKRLILKKGVLRIFTAEIPTDRIESIYCVQRFFGRLFNYGTICISGVGGMMPVFYMVYKPYTLRRKIVDIIEKNKVINVVHGDLPWTKPAEKPRPKVQEEPFYRYGTFVRVMRDK